jgi:hypothetical protein
MLSSLATVSVHRLSQEPVLLVTFFEDDIHLSYDFFMLVAAQ